MREGLAPSTGVGLSPLPSLPSMDCFEWPAIHGAMMMTIGLRGVLSPAENAGLTIRVSCPVYLD